MKMKIYETRERTTLNYSPRARIRTVEYPEVLKGYIIFTEFICTKGQASGYSIVGLDSAATLRTFCPR